MNLSELYWITSAENYYISKHNKIEGMLRTKGHWGVALCFIPLTKKAKKDNLLISPIWKLEMRGLFMLFDTFPTHLLFQQQSSFSKMRLFLENLQQCSNYKKKYTLRDIFLSYGFFCFCFGKCGGERERVTFLSLHCILFLAIWSSIASCFLFDVIN